MTDRAKCPWDGWAAPPLDYYKLRLSYFLYCKHFFLKSEDMYAIDTNSSVLSQNKPPISYV